MNNFREGIRVNRLAGTVTAGLSGLAILATPACSSEQANNTCYSPAAVSDTYPGNPAAVPGDFATWTQGIKITTRLPSDAEGVVVSYRPPTHAAWTDTSKLVPTGEAQEIALRIDKGDVVFGVQSVARLGAAACDIAPRVTFGPPQTFIDLQQQGVTEPAWQ